MPGIAALHYDNDYGMHSPQNCTSTHKGISHANWIKKEKYWDWKGQTYWKNVDGVMSHEQWLAHGLWVYHMSLESNERRQVDVERKEKQDKVRKDSEVIKYVGIGLGLLLVILVIWQFRSTEPTGDIGDTERWYGE